MSRFGIRRILKQLVMGNDKPLKSPTVSPPTSPSTYPSTSPSVSSGSSDSPQVSSKDKAVEVPSSSNSSKEPAVPVVKPQAKNTTSKEPEAVSEKDAKILKHRRRTKVALLKLIQKKGGTASLGDMHDLAEKRFFIAHKAFSDLMEEMVAEDIVHYDWSSQEATITQNGIELLETS